MTIKKGDRFVHATQLDLNWKPGPGQKYADAPKRIMTVTYTRGDSVWYGPGEKGLFVASLHQMVEGGRIVGSWL